MKSKKCLAHSNHQVQFSSVQLVSCVWLFVIPWTAACQTYLSITNSWTLLKLMSIQLVLIHDHLIICHPLLLLSSNFPSIRVFSNKSVMPFNHLILCCPLLLLSSSFPNIRVFSNESVLPIRWPKYWSFSYSISLSNEYSRLISLRWTGWISL